VTAAPVPASGIESADAANDLFERYHDRVYAFCMSRTRNRTDAEDATQTAFMYALNGLRRGVVPRFELTWLLRIAENVCHSMYRRAYRRYERDELPADVMSGQEDIALGAERLETLCHALESLPDKQRRAILLREWRGLSYTEIAEELNVSHAAVETMLFRARRSLAKQVGSLAALPMPSIGRLVRWIAGPGTVKAATVTAVTIGAATAVVSSAPAEPVQPVTSKPASTSTIGHVRPATPALPALHPAGTRPARAPEAAPSPTVAEPRLETVGVAPATPEAPITPPAESPTSEPPAGSVDAPTLLPPIVVPVDPAPSLETVTELTEALPTELVEVPPVDLPVDLPPLVTGLPLP
jgi:RNA polymerase sigma-70 factor, ECF subfamily